MKKQIQLNMPIEKDGDGVKVHLDRMAIGWEYVCKIAGINVIAVRTGPEKVSFYEIPIAVLPSPADSE